MRALAQDRVAAQLMGVNVDRYSMIGFALGAMLAGIVGGLLVTITGVNSGIGGPISIKAFMMVMIGGAGVVGGAIAGGFILGMMESVGLTVLHAYGDITYLVIFAALMVFLSIRPQRADGQAVGVMRQMTHAHEDHRLDCLPRPGVRLSSPCRSDRGERRTDLYYTLTSVALLSIASAGVWLTFYIGRINIGQGAYALIGGYVSAILVVTYGVVLLADAAARRPVLRGRERADRPADPAAARRLFRHGDTGPDRGRAASGAGAADHQRRQGHRQHPAARALSALRPHARPGFRHARRTRGSAFYYLAVVADGALLRGALPAGAFAPRPALPVAAAERGAGLLDRRQHRLSARHRLCDLVLPGRRRRRDVRGHLPVDLSVELHRHRLGQLHAELLPRRPRLRVRPDARHASCSISAGTSCSRPASTSS